ALIALLEAELHANDLAAAQAVLAEVEGGEARGRCDVLLVDALARRGEEAAALERARALAPRARGPALIRVSAARARNGNLDAALSLLTELEPRWQGEARLSLLEEEL